MENLVKKAEGVKFNLQFAVLMLNVGRVEEAQEAFNKAFDGLDAMIKEGGVDV